MISQKKSIALLSTLSKALSVYATQCLDPQLGDRSMYIGLSDIGKGIECFRSAVMGKLVSSSCTSNENHTACEDDIMSFLRRQITLQRGHWQEDGIGAAFNSFGLKSIPQLEIEVQYKDVPVKAHLDFILVWGGTNPAVRVLELKSNERIPKTLYSAYETQVYGQLSLLHAVWNKPCFNLRDKTGALLHTRQTFPQLAAQLFGVSLPEDPDSVDIEGWVVSLAMSDAKVFGPYVPDTTMLSICLQTAEDIWQKTQSVKEGTLSLCDLDFCKGFHPLCDWCDHNADCPKFRDVSLWNDPEVEDTLRHLAALKEQRKMLDAEVNAMEDRIKNTYAMIDPSGDWITAGSQRFRATLQPGRETLDRCALTDELLYLCEGDEERVASVLRNITKTGAAFERLFVSPVNGKPRAAKAKAA